jgi:hypothetical protein
MMTYHGTTGVYIVQNTSSPQGEGKYQPMSFGGNYEQTKRKRAKCKRKRKKGEIKR